MDILTAGGQLDAPVVQRVFWTIAAGAVAAVLLLAGGLDALQTATITTALPFTAVLLVACYGVMQGLRGEDRAPSFLNPSAPRSEGTPPG
jgi:choline-glycine betaine transporter